jgi:hypothetical protein
MTAQLALEVLANICSGDDSFNVEDDEEKMADEEDDAQQTPLSL